MSVYPVICPVCGGTGVFPGHDGGECLACLGLGEFGSPEELQESIENLERYIESHPTHMRPKGRLRKLRNALGNASHQRPLVADAPWDQAVVDILNSRSGRTKVELNSKLQTILAAAKEGGLAISVTLVSV